MLSSCILFTCPDHISHQLPPWIKSPDLICFLYSHSSYDFFFCFPRFPGNVLKNYFCNLLTRVGAATKLKCLYQPLITELAWFASGLTLTFIVLHPKFSSVQAWQIKTVLLPYFSLKCSHLHGLCFFLYPLLLHSKKSFQNSKSMELNTLPCSEPRSIRNLSYASSVCIFHFVNSLNTISRITFWSILMPFSHSMLS